MTTAPAAHDLTAPAPPRRRTAACVLLLLAVVFITFARLLASDFTWWDDQETIHHNALLNPPTLGTLRYYWTRMPYGLYVPVTYTVWTAIASVANVGAPDEFGITLNPTFFHFASVACHAGSAVLAFLILRRLAGADRPALLGAILFAVHPVQVETVGWVSGFKDMLCWLGALGVVLLYVRRVQRAGDANLWKSWEMPTAALVLALAILSKPTALVTPAALVAIDGLLLRKRWGRAIVDVAPLLLITAAGMVVARVAQTVAVFQHVPLWQRPLIVGDSLTFYLGKLAWPATLSPDYGRTPTVALADPWIYVRWLVPAAIAAALLVWHRRVPWLAAAFALFVIGVAPVSGIATFQMQAISTVTDHYLYFSVLGLAVALTWVVSRWPRQWVTATACALLAALAARSFVQTGIWRDAFALFEGTIRAHPRSTMARLNLVVCYLTKLTPEPEVAARYANEAYEIAPDDIIVLINYGVTRMAAGELDKAPAAFERAWQNAKSLHAAPKLLSDITKSAFETFRATTYHDEVVKWAERRLELEPGDANALVALGDARQAIAATRPTTGTTTAAPAPGPASAPSR